MNRTQSNPLGLIKKVTENHANHTTYQKTCKECVNGKLKKENSMIPCPKCGLYTLHETTSKISRDLEVYIYCSACHLHLGRTDNW
ncbi:hypothetical protein [Nitrosopumilus sp.]|uniref:hypothetical protein n=1 Tax=Nitrosopumilus sp. TaxID=2024843 RepID=UPI0026271535|nr:hypothetical protein [Nitrosopumilus sp.]